MGNRDIHGYGSSSSQLRDLCGVDEQQVKVSLKEDSSQHSYSYASLKIDGRPKDQ
jgi:hypothetical protein